MLKWIAAIIIGAFILKSCAAKLNEPHIGIAEQFNQAAINDRLKHPDLYGNSRAEKNNLPVYLVNVFYRDDKCWLTTDGYKIQVGLMTPYGKILSLRDDYAIAKDTLNNVKNYLIYDWRFLSVGSGAASAPEKASQNQPARIKTTFELAKPSTPPNVPDLPQSKPFFSPADILSTPQPAQMLSSKSTQKKIENKK